MRNRRGWSVFFFICALILNSACTGQSDPTAAFTRPLEIELAIEPETIYKGEKALIEAIVIQGTQRVSDASEAVFEISKKGENDIETIVATAKGNGKYAVEKIFAQVGTYTVKAKVTAQDLTAVKSQVLTIKEE
ncbi:FixH family protein [Aneurinibacillus sp. REN35]|uniref:FixH family protein n=1 Tax=Aneurinibacillus sp. REN35 TaxID=3237286 RepID=UPI0035270124